MRYFTLHILSFQNPVYVLRVQQVSGSQQPEVARIYYIQSKKQSGEFPGGGRIQWLGLSTFTAEGMAKKKKCTGKTGTLKSKI